jgi:hypothetical protein
VDYKVKRRIKSFVLNIRLAYKNRDDIKLPPVPGSIEYRHLGTMEMRDYLA